MARILSHPFQLAANGTVATVEQQSELADAQQIGVLALTVVGERPLVPGFGVSDPNGRGFNGAELAAGVATYGPPVTIRRVSTKVRSAVEIAVTVEFE